MTSELIGNNHFTVETSCVELVVESGVHSSGLIKRNRGFIRNTYTRGEVVVYNNVGGLVERSDEFDPNGNNAYINISYATVKLQPQVY